MLNSIVGRDQPAANDARMFDSRQSGGTAYFPSALLHAGLPVREARGQREWKRSSEFVTLRIVSGSDRAGQPIGIPYGSIARALLSWVSTEARAMRSPEIRLGSTVGHFLAGLGLDSSGGTNGAITRLRDQMRRLFTGKAVIERRQGNVLTQGELWTSNGDLLDEPIGSVLTLSEFFMTELVDHSVPIDRRAFLDLSQSPLAMDVYCWLTWRFSFTRSEQRLDWERLQQQFGSQAQTGAKFRETFRQALHRVRSVYPGIKVDPGTSYLKLTPSPTSVRRRRSQDYARRSH